MSDKLTHLLPCPFCGCTKVPKRQGNGIGDYWLECFDCGASTRLREDGAGMEKDWNRRPSPAPAIPACRCDMRTKVLGDGCQVCRPENAPAISESDQVLVPARVVELLHIINRDGLMKRATELQEVYRLVGAARKGEKS